MKKVLLGLAGFVALGFVAQGSVTQAQAQPYYPHYRPVPRYAPRPVGFVRPYPVYRHIPHCFVRPERIWNGFMWVDRPVRVCR